MESDVKKRSYKTSEFVVAAIIGAVLGALLMLWSWVYMPLSPILGPIGVELLYGMYFIPAIIVLYIMRKPGLGLLAAVVAGLIELLLGSPFGVHILVAAVVQGLGTELAFFIRKYKGDWLTLILAGIFPAILIFIRDFFVFGYGEYPVPTLLAMIGLRIVSGAILGGIFSKIVCDLVKKTGALNNFAIGKETK